VTRPEGPTVSVVLATFDQAARLPHTLGLVLAQHVSGLEVVVVDDGSTDDTAAVLAAVTDPRLRTVHQANGGISRARNAGAAAATGDYLLFVDDDDRPHPTWAATLVAAATDRPPVVSCGVRFVDADGNVARLRRPTALGPVFSGLSGLFLAGTFLVRRDVFEAVGGFAPDLQCSHATEFALRLGSWCVEAGEDAVTVDELLIDIVRRDVADRPESSAAKLWSGTSWILEHHDGLLSRAPGVHANFLGIAGVAAARLGRWPDARRCLRRAARLHPTPRTAARALLPYLPPLARRVWCGSGVPTSW